jgi:5'-3' exoribonuclease 2
MLTDKNGIDILFLLYTETLINRGNLTNIKNNKVTLNLDQLIYFFEQLSQNEELLLKKKYPKNTDISTFNDNIVNDYKQTFYKDKFKFDTDNPIKLKKQINKLCNEYVKGLQFVLLYYLYDIPDWYWFYPYHYSPFFSDIYEYLNSLKLKRLSDDNNSNILSFKFEKNEPLTPFEQLLAVLPPESSDILPDPFSSLMTCKESDIYHFYPETSTIKVEIKSEYEKTILVPFIDVDLLRKTFKSTFEKNKEMLEKHESRNIFKNTKFYINSNKFKL